MSKYYKAEDMENLIINIAPDGEVFELGMSALQNLPTIEVSEDCISRKINAPRIVPMFEDCISRKWLEEHIEVVSYKNMWYETETDEFVSWANIENAPSVVPKERIEE